MMFRHWLAFLKIGELSTHPENINLQNLNVSLKDFAFNNSVIKVGLRQIAGSQRNKRCCCCKNRQPVK